MRSFVNTRTFTSGETLNDKKHSPFKSVAKHSTDGLTNPLSKLLIIEVNKSRSLIKLYKKHKLVGAFAATDDTQLLSIQKLCE